jgi:hypothetical protein
MYLYFEIKGLCTLLKNCTIKCICDPRISYGEFCQFSRQTSVYSKEDAVNILNDECDDSSSINFNLEVKPCLISAWQRANPDFCMNFTLSLSYSKLFFICLKLNPLKTTLKTSIQACPSGYEIIPGLDGKCFFASSRNQDTLFAKNTAEYECSLSGASLIALETEEKLNLIINWLSK